MKRSLISIAGLSLGLGACVPKDDTADDSSVDSVEEPDLAGCAVTRDSYEGQAELPSERLVTTYNDNGDYALLEWYSFPSGEPELSGRTVYSYDDDGLLIRMDQYPNDPEWLEYWTIFSHEDGLLAMEESYRVYSDEPDAEGELIGRMTYSYDQDGRLAEQAHDPVEGAPMRWVYSYDGDLLVTYEYDYGADGTIDARFSYGYDEDGTLLTDEYDDAVDGVVDIRWTYRYDERGNLIAEEKDGPVDGETGVYADGEVDRLINHSYDDSDLLVRSETDYDADGTASLRVSYGYDEEERLVSVETDGGYDQTIDGVIDARQEYVYDCP
jgi:hypothetical protein